MTSSITRCPKCKTTFRVTQKQLQSAKGAVRCGSCLHIFDARENFIKRTADQPRPEPVAAKPIVDAPSAPPKTTKKTPESAPTPVNQLAFDQNAIDSEADNDSEDFLISDDMEPEEPKESRYDEGIDDMVEFKLDSGNNNWSDDNQSLFGSAPSNTLAEENEENQEDADESWALEMLEEEHDSSEPLAKPEEPFKESFEEPNREEFSEASFQDPPKQQSLDEFIQEIDDDDDRFDGSKTGSFDSFNNFDDNEFDNFGEPSSNGPKRSTHDDFDDELNEAFRDTETADGFSLEDFDNDDQSHLEESLVPDSSDRQDLLNALEPAPLEMTFEQKGKHRWLIKTAFITGNIVLLLALILQIGYLKFDTWSRVEPYRDWYSLACPLFGCTLPTRHDYEKIRITLVVRSHPEAENALVADAILLNTAKFQQPFPSLAIRFSDINDNPIAERIFLPGEYLRGELAGAQQMPIGQPVHISLQVADPGSDAVNYRAFIPIH